jgi:hypothetical protein
MKTFLTKDFFHLTPVVHLDLRISPLIFEKNLKWVAHAAPSTEQRRTLQLSHASPCTEPHRTLN